MRPCRRFASSAIGHKSMRPKPMSILLMTKGPMPMIPLTCAPANLRYDSLLPRYTAAMTLLFMPCSDVRLFVYRINKLAASATIPLSSEKQSVYRDR